MNFSEFHIKLSFIKILEPISAEHSHDQSKVQVLTVDIYLKFLIKYNINEALEQFKAKNSLGEVLTTGNGQM